MIWGGCTMTHRAVPNVPISRADLPVAAPARILRLAMRTFGLAALLGLGLTGSARALTIIPVFASVYGGADYGLGPVVSLAGNTLIDNAVIAADQQIASLFSNKATVNILYFGNHGGAGAQLLGASVTPTFVIPYADYVNSLAGTSVQEPNNAVLATAVANLGAGNGAADPGNTLVNITPAHLQALGAGFPGLLDKTGAFAPNGGPIDGMVFLNIDQPFSYTRPTPPFADGFTYDAQAALEQEIDEVLGVGGSGSTLNILAANPGAFDGAYGLDHPTTLGVQDLYRYSAAGVPSFQVNPTYNPNEEAYFSIDGGHTNIVNFNQADMVDGDAGDFDFDESLAPNLPACPGQGYFAGPGFVQDAFRCNNVQSDVTTSSPEYIAFEAIGYNPVPEPATWDLLLLGFGGLGAVIRSRRRTAIVHA